MRRDSVDKMKTLDEPLCADCNFWRDYSGPIEMQEHPDYDGHCWLKGIMTLNVTECREHGKSLTVREGKIVVNYDDENA